VTPKLYKAAEVCEMTQLQPYVLRSWEKEFPGIGVQKSQDGPRLYRQADVDQVLRIKQLVFGEGLTLAGARKRLDDSGAAGGADAAGKGGTSDAHGGVVASPRRSAGDVTVSAEGSSTRRADVSIGADARTRVARVREGLRSILTMLSARPAAEPSRAVEDYRLEPPSAPKAAKVRKLAARRPAAKRAVTKRRSARV
jgi:DNA-binding transcriptional MerR regulator